MLTDFLLFNTSGSAFRLYKEILQINRKRILFAYFSVWPLPKMQKFLGQGSDLSHSSNLSHSSDSARSLTFCAARELRDFLNLVSIRQKRNADHSDEGIYSWSMNIGKISTSLVTGEMHIKSSIPRKDEEGCGRQSSHTLLIGEETVTTPLTGANSIASNSHQKKVNYINNINAHV